MVVHMKTWMILALLGAICVSGCASRQVANSAMETIGDLHEAASEQLDPLIVDLGENEAVEDDLPFRNPGPVADGHRRANDETANPLAGEFTAVGPVLQQRVPAERTAATTGTAAAGDETPTHVESEAETDAEHARSMPMERGDGDGILSARMRGERVATFNPYLLTAHKQNYFIPFSISNAFNHDVYETYATDGFAAEVKHTEVKFQLSLKTRLNENDLLFRGDSLNFGVTLRSWWQLYSEEISSPFRETNYQPEIFYVAPLLKAPVEGRMAIVFGFEHESNGQVQGLSRSWNRLYTSLLYENGNFGLALKPWFRIPESAKENPEDAEGDDNPDILDYMGYGELALGWRSTRYDVLATIRGNTSTGKGALQLEATYPFFSRYRGFVQFFTGYGESLIDHDIHQTRIGVGVALSSLF